MNEIKVKNILETYQEMVEKTKEALRLAEMPESMITSQLINLPDLDEMLPEEVLQFYKDVRKAIILFYDSKGFTLREISRRLGGGAAMTHIVWQILKEKRGKEKVKKASIEEVISED